MSEQDIIDFETLEIISDDGKVMVELEWIGEGLQGDYDSTDPDDYPHLRFTVYRKYNKTDEIPPYFVDNDDYEENSWMPINDSSYCTRLSAQTDKNILIEAANIILSETEEQARNFQSIKKMCERLSWIIVNGDGKILY